MNLSNLKCFADAARLKSMTKAAELNHLSRPAISYAIQSLEDELGVALLNHRRRAFELTQAGQLLVSQAEALLDHAEQVRATLKQKDGPLVGEFRIGAARTLATFWLQDALASLKRHFPLVQFHVTLDTSQTLIEKLSNREIDAAFFIGDETLSQAKQVIISRGSFVLVRPKELAHADTL
jgi:DNA-binding transcriptional LysR family regulator